MLCQLKTNFNVWFITKWFIFFSVVFSFKTKKHKLDYLSEHLKEGKSKLLFYLANMMNIMLNVKHNSNLRKN